jgi:hypothetical protein
MSRMPILRLGDIAESFEVVLCGHVVPTDDGLPFPPTPGVVLPLEQLKAEDENHTFL